MLEKTFAGGSVNTTEKRSPEGSLTTSRKNEKRNTRKTGKNITPAVAAALLTSALNYCLEAGLTPLDYGDAQTLKLEISGLRYSNDRIEAVTTEVTTESGSNDRISPEVTTESDSNDQSNDR